MPPSLDSQPSLNALRDSPFAAADRMLVAYLRDELGESSPWILLAAALCSQAAREGHSFLDLREAPESWSSEPARARTWLSLREWQSALAASPSVRAESGPSPRPLVVCDGYALYLDKYYKHERRLAELLREMGAGASATSSRDPVERALSNRLFAITGGPGTGKTTLALRYLNALHDRWQTRDAPPRCAAVAPTGKATARLAESIAAGVARLDVDAERRARLLATPCLTIHRLLGTLPHQVSFRRNASRPFNYDALVVDESSMIDLPLMRRLLEATPPECSLLLLGDRDQLSSVEVGSVLHDIIEAAEDPKSLLHGKVERLTTTYRFSQDSAIFRACELARAGDEAGFAELLREELPGFAFHPLTAEAHRPPDSLLRHALERHEKLAACASAEEAIARLNDSIILAPTRHGAFGAQSLNGEIERRLRIRYSLTQNAPIHGLPIIVLENAYELSLFNGDLGVVWMDDGNGPAYARFPGENGAARRFRLSALPRHESAFALTIHKSQGSEFRETVAVFGPRESRLLTRELIYTAFSRARERLVVYAEPALLAASVARQARRATRLAALLR